MKTTSHEPGSGSSMQMSESADVLIPNVAIDWSRSAPWWRLLSQSLTIGWRASHLMVAAIAIALSSLGWWIASQLFGPGTIQSLPFSEPVGWTAGDGILSIWRDAFPLADIFAQPLTLRRAAYLVFGLLWTMGIWSFAGGLLARRSLMELGLRTSVGWSPTFRLVCRRWSFMMWAMIMPLVAIIGLCFVPLVLGFVARWGTAGETIGLVLMVPTVLLSLGIGWCGVIAIFGAPMSICAIVGEVKADAFDGLSRSAAYVFQRPMTILLILVASSALAWLGSELIRIVLMFGEQTVWQAFSMGYGKSIGKASPLPNSLFVLCQDILRALYAGFLFSFFWSSSAAAYLLLRFEIDHTDFDELDLQEIGEPVPLPAFQQDERGVQEIASSPANATSNAEPQADA